MGADQIAAIRPMIVELADAASEGTDDEFCASFIVSGQDETWVQVVPGKVNLAYPFNDDPNERLQRLGIMEPPGLVLEDWQPCLFATFTYDESASSREVAKFVDALFSNLLGCGGDYPLDVKIEKP